MGKSKNRFLFEESMYCNDIDNKLSKSFYALHSDLEENNFIDGDVFSHIMRKHVENSVDQMRLMCERNQTYECTTFLSKEDCIRAIRYGLSSQWFNVTNWLKFETGDKLVLNCDMPFDTSGTDRIHGIGIDRDDLEHVYTCHTQCIILKRVPKSRHEFKIFTAYPTYRTMKAESERFRDKVAKELSKANS